MRECKKCNAIMDIPNDLKPTDYCNLCAQERIKELEALMQRAYDCIPKGSVLQKEFEQVLKGE